MEKYANAQSVNDFYYTLTVSLNGSDDLNPVETSSQEEAEQQGTQENEAPNAQGMPGMGGDMQEKGSMGGFSTANDPANQIYLSYSSLKAITQKSAENAQTQTDEETGIETTTAIPEQVSGTYCFACVEDYEAFEGQARELGLADEYTVSSSDLNAFEQSILPLENLSAMAGYFLIVILGIGAVVLVVLNIFNVRERKYEVGVLTAIGMKKRKVALQFITEIFAVTICAIIIGGAVGAVSSVPVTNSLLENQIQSQQTSAEQMENSFNRPVEGADMNKGDMMKGSMSRGGFTPNIDYVTEISSATDLNVLLQLVAIGILLTLVASAASVVFIMRYEPLKILANRD